MPNIGFPEMMVLLVIVLLLFGPKKLPDFARSMGQAIREFRRASQEVMDDIHRAVDEPRTTKPRTEDFTEEPVVETAAAEKPAAEQVSTKQL